jgi:SAM-dependent methyltransferase
MQAYTGFAQVYDIFMDNVPYDEWANYLAGLLQEYGLHSGLVLELGCGTGSITRRLAAKGYDMIGIDISEEMLEIARDLEYNRDFDPSEDFIEADELQERNNILYLQQDMREFELYGTVSAVVSICDSMNYITSEEELLKVFQLVNNYLDRGGTFIFDMNTVHKYKDILADNTFAENREDCSFIWDNYYYEDKMMNEYDVTIFVKVDEEAEDELEADEKETLKEEYEKTRSSSVSFYEKYEEFHYQKAYTIDTVIRLIEKSGMEFITVYDAFTRNSPDEESERVYFVAREKHQENKLYI